MSARYEDIVRIRGNYGEEKFLELLKDPTQDKIDDLHTATGLYFEVIEVMVGCMVFALNLHYYLINIFNGITDPFNFVEVTKVTTWKIK